MTTDNTNVNITFLLKKTVVDTAKKEVDGDREAVFRELSDVYEKYGSKSFVVKLPDGEKVATFTITEPKAKDEVDEAGLIEWLEDNGYGDQVLTKTIPAREEKSIKAGALKAIGAWVADDGHYVTPAGEIVEGIRKGDTPEPKSFSVRYEKGGQDRVLEAWQAGELADVDAGEALPQIGTTHVVEGNVVDDTPADEDKEHDNG